MVNSKVASNSLQWRGRESIIGYLFILPFAVGYIIFHFIPLFSSLIISFTNLGFINNLSSVRFIGMENYLKLLHDPQFINALLRSLYYSLLFVPLVMVMGLLFALLINSGLYGRNIIRTALFLPYVSNFVAIAIVWSLLLDYHSGPINMFLKAIGIQSPPLWLLGEHSVIPTIVMIVAWQNIGLFMVTFLAALQNVSKELYEAAEIDGANMISKFFRITLPSISPTSFFLLITALIVSFQNFTPIQVLTKGGPGEASTTLSMNIYLESFTIYHIGYATTQALVMFGIIMIITVFQWKGQKKWVNYV